MLEDKRHRLPAADLVEIVRDARRRTLDLVSDLEDDELEVPPLPQINPPRWELGHVAFFYEVFFLRLLGRTAPFLAGADELFDSFRIAHDTRWSLPLPDRSGTLDYMASVEEAVLERLGDGTCSPKETYLALLCALHEDMHGEALTYTRQTLEYRAPSLNAEGSLPPLEAGPLDGDAHVPGGTLSLGAAPEDPFVFDNEKWQHPVEVAPFDIARTPVTNAGFAAFVDAGGYRRREWWDVEGWLYRSRLGKTRPTYWVRTDGGWYQRRFDRVVPLEPHQPVSHVSWYEARAFCRWAGRRLPSEAEWEMAAVVETDSGHKRAFPWGDEPASAARANLDSDRLGVVDVGAYPDSDSPSGCRQMIGNVWEWTDDAFYPFPGYLVDVPYREYSAPWFGYHKVLKGGAWASRSRLVRTAYRNFFLPERSDVLAGFRTCAL